MTDLPSSDIRALVDDLFPGCAYEHRLLLEAEVRDILEGKDIGRFKGDVSIFKQRAIDTAAAMPRPVVTRRGIEKDAKQSLDKLVARLERDMEQLVSRLRSEDPSRQLSKTQFRKRMKAAMRIAYKDAYDLGTLASGLGRANSAVTTHASPDEKQWLDNMFSQEQKYFNKFLAALERGESRTKASQRIRSYANAVRSIFEGSRVLQIPDNTVLHWVLQSKNPCSDCRLIHRLSPYTKYTLPTTPKAGSTRCLANCYCKIRVVKATPAEVARVARKNKSAEHILKKLRANRKRG